MLRRNLSRCAEPVKNFSKRFSSANCSTIGANGVTAILMASLHAATSRERISKALRDIQDSIVMCGSALTQARRQRVFKMSAEWEWIIQQPR